MKLDVTIYDKRGNDDLALVAVDLKKLLYQGVAIMASLADLQAKADALLAKVEAESTIEASLVQLLTGLAENNKQLAAALKAAIAANDPAAIQAVANSLDQDSTLLDTNIATLTEALKANTPAA